MSDRLEPLETPVEHTRRDTRRSLYVFGAAAALMLVLAAALHGFGWWQFQRAADASLPTSQRLAAADTARRLEPFQAGWRARYGALRAQWGYERAQAFYVQGKLTPAVDAMAEAYKYAVGNQVYLTYFTKLQDEWAAATNRKAHLQHGHEGPGGTLAPKDIER